MAEQRPLEPLIKVRILVPELGRLSNMCGTTREGSSNATGRDGLQGLGSTSTQGNLIGTTVVLQYHGTLTLRVVEAS